MLLRVLQAGKAQVYLQASPPPVDITHVLAKPLPEDPQGQAAPCYPLKHVVQHLFGVALFILAVRSTS